MSKPARKRARQFARAFGADGLCRDGATARAAVCPCVPRDAARSASGTASERGASEASATISREEETMPEPDAEIAPRPETVPEFAALSDDALLGLLATEGDALPRAAVDEVVRRADRMVGPLTAICEDARAWEDTEGAPFWRQVHGALILGAIGGERALPGLLAALRNACEHEVDWVELELPAMLGRIGRPAIAGLLAVARDRDEEYYARVLAFECLAGIAARNEAERSALLDTIRALVEREKDEDVRGLAALELLHFARPTDLAFFLAEAKRQERMGGGPAADLTVSVVRASYAIGPDLESYERDWLEFYDEDAIAERRARFAEEDRALASGDSDGGGADDGDAPREGGGLTLDELEERDALVSPSSEPVAEPVVPRSKVGRNEPCPCGSGAKFKRCCGAT
jgi:hypothetical protein